LRNKRLALLKNKKAASVQAGYRNGRRNETEKGRIKILRE